jgi:ankyrin repeat protein
MLSIKRKNVPEYLHNSELYTTIRVPERLHYDKIFNGGELIIDNINDLYKVMNIIKYYKLNVIPDEVYQFIIDNLNCKNEQSNIINKVLIDELINKFNDCFELKLDNIDNKIIFNSAELVQFIEHKIKQSDVAELFVKTIDNDYENLFKVLYNKQLMGNFEYEHRDHTVNKQEFTDLYTKVGEKGNYEIIKYIIDSFDDRNTIESLEIMMHIIRQTMKNKQYDLCTKYILKQMRLNKSHCTQCNKKSKYTFPYDKDLMIFATENNRLDMIKYMQSENFKNTKLVLTYAARNGYLDILQYYLDIYKSHYQTRNGIIPICNEAITNNHFNCVKYLFENGASCDIFSVINVIKNDRLEIFKYLFKSIKINAHDSNLYKTIHYHTAISSNAIKCIKYMHKKKLHCAVKPDDLDIMIKNNYFDLIEYLATTKSLDKSNCDICALAGKYGHLKMLKYLRKNGFSWDDRTCNFSEQNRHYECFKYAYEKGCPWGRTTKNITGHRNMISYMNEMFPQIE